MTRSIHHSLLVLIFGLLISCAPEKQMTQFKMLYGDSEVVLESTESVDQFRSEIIAHIRTRWENRAKDHTEWFEVSSVYSGGEKEAKAELGISGEGEAMIFTSTRATGKFRIRKRKDGSVLVEKLTNDGEVKENSSASHDHWELIEACVNSILNQHLLESILKNNGELQR